MKIMIIVASLLSLFGCRSAWKGIESDTITSFSLREGGGMNRFSGFGYSIRETKDGKVHFLFDEGLPSEKEFVLDDHSVFDSLQQVIMKHKMYTYHDHYQSPFDVTDGTSWSLSVRYVSGNRIDAGGYMHGPKGYRDAFRDIDKCLEYWKNLPVSANEVVTFLYDYGKEHYTFKREDDHALLIFDNEETGDHQELVRDLEMMEDLRIFVNIEGFKMNNTNGDLDFEYTPWSYDITYSNGDHYRYEGYDRDFKCGYTHILQGFVSHWMQETEHITPYYYHY